MSVGRAVLRQVVDCLTDDLPGLRLDGWLPSVQGAVGHVVGLRDGAGRPCVLKIYPAGAAARMETELRAQLLLAGVEGIVVPRPLAHGRLPATPEIGYLLMTRLAGTRWADFRPTLTAETMRALTREAGVALRRLHVVRGRRYGTLNDDGTSWPDAWSAISARAEDSAAQYASKGGPPDLARRFLAFVQEHRCELYACPAPVLCHNDFISSNLLICEPPDPHLCGVVDLERAASGDPLSDLAQTRLHIRHHAPAEIAVLLDGYGVAGSEELARIDVYEALHALEQRTWIVQDRPSGWRRSVAALDALLEEWI